MAPDMDILDTDYMKMTLQLCNQILNVVAFENYAIVFKFQTNLSFIVWIPAIISTIQN